MESGSIKENIIKLRKEGKSYNEIKEIIGCSKSTISYHCKREGLDDIGLAFKKLTNDEIDQIKEYYKIHTLEETSKKFKISITTIKRHAEKRILYTVEERKAMNYNHVKTFRNKTKEKAVEYKGGKCTICGYNRCMRALDFHHLNPDEKDFGISFNTNRAWDKIKNELDKCVLVCANCHREIHDGLIDINT